MKARAARLGADQGQAIVEAAVVMPAMMFMVLVIIQLTMLQHARIMTEYAAFSAARAGIVYNAEKDAMRRAASVALLPTMARTDTLARVIGQQGRLAGIENSQRSAFGLPIVHVEILNPRPSHFSPAITRHLGGQEIDFDDIRTQAAMANQLEIRIRYFYRMPIPFANQMLQAIWFAQRSGSLVSWRGMGMTRPEIVGISAIEDAQSRASGGLGAADMETRQQYLGVASAARARLYYFPLEATYTMRMQSNVFLKNVQ